MPFEKDLGYLVKFFDKLEAHAASLDVEAGARLTALLRDERARWDEITRLLKGAPLSSDVDLPAPTPTEDRADERLLEEPSLEPSSARSPRDEDIGRVPPPHRAAHSVPAPPSAVGARLTVGSLIGKGR